MMDKNKWDITRHTITYSSKQEKETSMNFLRHIKHKTGDNFGKIILKALQEYNIGLE